MADLYADEHFPKPVVEHLRKLGHNMLTAQEAGRANQRIPDDQVLKDAEKENRAVITMNRMHFRKLHRQNNNHSGIIICKEDPDSNALAQRIDNFIRQNMPLSGKLIRVIKG